MLWLDKGLGVIGTAFEVELFVPHNDSGSSELLPEFDFVNIGEFEFTLDLIIISYHDVLACNSLDTKCLMNDSSLSKIQFSQLELFEYSR